jgi:Carbohydrate esterase, sialic acid-specific acetylesterase
MTRTILAAAALGLSALAATAEAGCTGGTNDLCIVRAYNDAQSTDWLANWMLIQRDGAGAAVVPVPFRYRATVPVRLEVRVVSAATGIPLSGFDYANHTLNLPAAGTLTLSTLTLTGVPQGGNYHLDGRLVPQAGGSVLVSDTIQNLAVGDVYLAGGQSNMTGAPNPKATAGQFEPPDDRVHLFGNDYLWKRAVEPMDSGAGQVDAISVDGSYADQTLMLRFGKEVAIGAGVPVAIIPGPRAGTCLIGCDPTPNWQRDPANPQNRGTLYGSLVYRGIVQRYRSPIRGLIFYQGEGDVGRTLAEYKTALQAEVASWRSDLGSPNLFFGNVQLATQWLFGESPADREIRVTKWMNIQEAQRQVMLADPKSTIIGTADIPRDFIHLSVDGYKEAGRRLGLTTLRDSYTTGTFHQPRATGACIDANAADRVVVFFDKNVQINPGSTNALHTLFRVFDAGMPVEVTGATISGGNVTLQLTQPIVASAGCCGSTAATVSYGYGTFYNFDPWLIGTDGSGAAILFKDLRVGA